MLAVLGVALATVCDRGLHVLFAACVSSETDAYAVQHMRLPVCGAYVCFSQ
jgi:hypothetical protein